MILLLNECDILLYLPLYELKEKTTMKLKFITLVIASFLGLTLYAQNIDTQKIDDFVSHIEDNNRGIGSLSIFKNGKEIYNRSFGQKQLDNITYNAETKYQVGSITKMITATLAFKLIEQNKLHLDDKLSEFFPQIPNSDKITIKNLLEHSSGLGDYVTKEDNPTWLTKKVSKKEIFDEIIKQGSLFEPNSKVEYSNSGYFLLTQILEKLYNKSYASIVKTEIAKPLKLQNFESTTDNTTNTFPSFTYTEKWEPISDFDFSNAIGLGDIVATTKDLNTFLYNLFQYKILKEESVKQMIPDTTKKETFGRGIMFIPFYEKVLYGHGGDTRGTHSMVAYNEEDQLGVSSSINGQRFSHNNFAIGILSIIYGKEYKYPDFNTITLKPEELDKFLGVYSGSDFPLKLTISKDGNKLKAQAEGQPSFYLECYEINKFKFDDAEIKFEFIPEENKLIFNQAGAKFELTKE